MNAPANIKPSLIGALAKALPELESAKKNKTNPAFKSKYADLTAIIEALEPIREHDLWYRQVALEDADGAKIETFYIHASGEELSAGVTFMPASKRDAQGFGSALSYCRRYGLQTAFGLATEDDDGNAAVKSRMTPEAAPKPIDDAQWSMLVQLIEATSSDTQKICLAHKVESLRDLTPEQAGSVKGVLEKRLAKMAKETANA